MACNSETQLQAQYRQIWASFLAGQITAWQVAEWARRNGYSYASSYSSGPQVGANSGGQSSTTTTGGSGGSSGGGGSITPGGYSQTFTSSVTVYPPPPLLPCPPPLPVPNECDSRDRGLLRDFLDRDGLTVNHPYVYNTVQAETVAKRIANDNYGLRFSRVVTVPWHYPIDVLTLVSLDDVDGKKFFGLAYSIEFNLTNGQATKTVLLIKVREDSDNRLVPTVDGVYFPVSLSQVGVGQIPAGAVNFRLSIGVESLGLTTPFLSPINSLAGTQLSPILLWTYGNSPSMVTRILYDNINGQQRFDVATVRELNGNLDYVDSSGPTPIWSGRGSDSPWRVKAKYLWLSSGNTILGESRTWETKFGGGRV